MKSIGIEEHFYIGQLRIKNRLVLAPIAGVSDKAFRIISKSFGCGLVFTEMVSSLGLVYEQQRTRKMADLSDEESPVAVQIFGSDAGAMATAAEIVEKMGADLIDVNMGCPTPKIVKNGEGAALMLDIGKSRRIIREIIKRVSVPVTIKMRKGWDETNINCIELAEVAEDEGVSAVTLHPRTRVQFFSGHADWEMIKAVKKRLTIPVIGNGDISRAIDVISMVEKTACDAVMIGRAAMGNPFIFREILEFSSGGNEIQPVLREERITTALQHLDLACRYKGEKIAIKEMRKHFAWYVKNMKGATGIRQHINKATTREQLISALNSSTP